jgi:hypothetical protein
MLTLYKPGSSGILRNDNVEREKKARWWHLLSS